MYCRIENRREMKEGRVERGELTDTSQIRAGKKI